MRRISLVLICLMIAGLVVIYWLRLRAPAATSSAFSKLETSPDPQLSGAAKPLVARPGAGSRPAGTRTPQEERREAINSWEQAREREIEFWGKVVDQYNEPVGDVEVTATTTSHRIPPAGFKPQLVGTYEARSDASGIFFIKAPAGRGFTIERMAKPGYLLPPDLQKRRGSLFWYNYDQLDPKAFNPAAGEPVVFHLWKLGQPEQLVGGEIFYGVVPDGTINTIDLLTKKHAPGETAGDIRVSIQRPADVKWGDRDYDWSWRIEGVDGGLIETDDEFMFRAPEEGYQPSIEVKVSPGPDWHEDSHRRLYLRSRAGRVFARLEVEVLANYRNKAVFSVKYFANPKGSRSLEPGG